MNLKYKFVETQQNLKVYFQQKMFFLLLFFPKMSEWPNFMTNPTLLQKTDFRKILKLFFFAFCLLYDYTNLDSFKINPFLAELYSEDFEAKKKEKRKMIKFKMLYQKKYTFCC
jgi:hypothetical protein